MRALATLRLPFAFLLLLAGFAGRAEAQINPIWDHYKVYEFNPKPPGTLSVFLRDQFTQSTHGVVYLDQFMNPVEKTHLSSGATSPIHDPALHYTWWRITDVPFDATVSYANQFGGGSVQLLYAQYLLNPALKNQITPPLPIANHYKCYACQGPPITVPLRLVDQFDTWQVDQLRPIFFCTPTEKQVPGAVYPIVDPERNYVCYLFQPPDPQPFPALIRDQFIQTNGDLRPGHLLCVPTQKLTVTKTADDTWGRLKLLYR